MPAEIPYKTELSQLTPNKSVTYLRECNENFNPHSGSSLYLDNNWAKSTGDVAFSRRDIFEKMYLHFDLNRQHIKLAQSLSEQIEQNPELKNAINAISLISETLISLGVDKISLQSSFDKSFFYTFIKNGYKVFFQYFIDNDADADQIVFTITKEGKNIINYGGTYELAKEELFRFFDYETRF